MADEIIKTNTTPTGAQGVLPSLAGNRDPNVELTEIQKEIGSRYELLPEDLKQIIVGDQYRMDLFQIAKDTKLTYEELGTLEIETTMVLLGMTRPEEYRDEIQLQLKKNDAEINALVKMVNERIFTPIRALLEKIYSAKKEPEDFLKEKEEKNANLQTPKIVTQSPNLTDKEKSVLEKTGVILSETPAPIKSASPATMPNRSDILSGIENPVRTPRPSIVADKLAGISTVPQNKTTDYSMPKTTSPVANTPAIPTPPRTGTDPYRERPE